MFLVLFALFMVLPWALFDNVSTKPGLKVFRDEYKSVTAACLDLGFAKKACNSGYYIGINSNLQYNTGILSHLAEKFLSPRTLLPTSHFAVCLDIKTLLILR